jgi:hypothetical protein
MSSEGELGIIMAKVASLSDIRVLKFATYAAAAAAASAQAVASAVATPSSGLNGQL